MGNRIKGITIEIDGNTKGLDKALSGITKEATQTSKELKDVNRLLKLNPGNTELIAQKQALLSKQVANTSEKLKTLKSVQEQVDSEFKKGNIGEEQYRAFQREIQATEGQLNGYKGELASVESEQSKLASSTEKVSQSHRSIGKSLDTIADKSGKAGKAMSIGVTAPLIAAGTAGVKAFKDIDTAEADVIRSTGATGKQADSLRASFEHVAGNSAASLEDISSAVGGVATRFNFTGKELDEASSKFLTFAAVNKVDVQTAVTDVSRAMGDAGIKSKDYGQVLDMLTVAHQKSGIQVDKLAESLAKYGAPMRQLGFDTKSSIAMFAGWEKAGVNTEIAFSGMKKAISTWGKENKKPMDEFPKAMEKIKKSTNPVADAIAIFGAKAGPDLADAITQGRFSYEDYVKALDNSNGTLQKSASETGAPYKDFTKIMHNLQITLAETGRAIMTSVGPSMKDLLTHIQGLVKWFSQLSPKTKTNALAIAAIAAAVGPVLIGFSKMINAIKVIKDAFLVFNGVIKSWQLITKAGTAIQTAFNAVMAINPFVLIGVAIVAVVALLVWFFTQTKTGQQMWQNFGNFMKNLWQGLVQFAQQTWQNLGQFFNALWTGVKNVTESVWNGIKAFFGLILNAIKLVITAEFNFYKAIITTIIYAIKQVITIVWNAIKAVTSTIFNAIKAVITVVWNGIRSVISGAVNIIRSVVTTAWNGIKAVTSNIFNAVKGVISSIWNGIKSVINGVVNSVKSIVTNGWNGVKSITQSVWNGLKAIMVNPVNAAKNIIANIVNAIKGFFRNMHLSIPAIKLPPMPHFSMRGNFSFNPPRVPSIGVKWYAKGAIFKKPALFDGPTGLSGAGEAGPEAMLPLNRSTLGMIGDQISKNMGLSGQPIVNITVNGGDNPQEIGDIVAAKVDEVFRKQFNSQSLAYGGRNLI